MKNEVQLFGGNAQYMSSVEIAELTGKEHRNVMADITNMFSQLGGCAEKSAHPSYETEYQNSQNKQMYACWMLNKNDAILLVSGYSVILRKRIIDRWDELENKNVLPTTYLGALEKLVEEVRAREQLQLENQRQQEVIQEKTEDVQLLKGTLSNREYEKLMTPTELSRELSASPEWSVIEGEKRFDWNPSSHDIMNYLRGQKLIFKSEEKVSQKGIDNYSDTIVFEHYGFRKQLKFNINSQQFVRFVKDMKKFMIENRIGLQRNKFIPGMEF